MERSSPLAAIQPPSVMFGHWKCGDDRTSTNTSLKPPSFGLNAFNFKDMSMRRGPDYFSIKPGRTNSPTNHLAVDLSQNFHIDKSPAPPTPRRSLFSAVRVETHEVLKTPPASSPSPMVESMDISPLPHKAPFAKILLQSPASNASSEDTLPPSDPRMTESPVDMLPPPVPERRRAPPPRPVLSRAKGYSTTSVGTTVMAQPPPPQPFTFGVPPPALTLEDCFIESPPRSAPIPLAPAVSMRPKSMSQKATFGCPPSLIGRKACAPYQRPRKQFRRSLSMFEHPEDVMQQQAEPVPMQAIMDIDEGPQMQLPHFFQDQESIPRISKETMVDVLDGKYVDVFTNSIVVDCRFEYEYNGGHIEGAVNFNDKEELARSLFSAPADNTLIILHCEYSAHRAPIAARFLRAEDRTTNAHQYPKLTYPQLYILDGGYSCFFRNFKTRCFPQNYVEMNDAEFASACERGMGRLKQQRNKLSRAQTFAFGQPHNESPTAAPRQPSRTTTGGLLACMDIVMEGSSPLDPAKRIDVKRSASY